MKNYNILVIGNGFDLYHGLKTNYMDFVRFCKELIETEKGIKGRNWAISNSFVKCFINVASENQSWIDCEREIEAIVTMFLKILFDRNVFDTSIGYNHIQKNNTSLSSSEFERLKLMNRFCEKSTKMTITLRDNYFKTYAGIDKKLIMEKLKEDLNSLINLFKYYLEKEIVNQTIERKSKQIEEISLDYVINFNYTNTCEEYGVNRQDICYIHGSVQENNIVLGIRDIDEKDINSIYFKKFFQRMQKHTDIIRWDEFEGDISFSGISKNINTYFFGHSLSNNDGDLIRNIYENSCKITIFHLKTHNDYEQKIINLIETLGKEIVVQGIHSRKIEFIPIE